MKKTALSIALAFASSIAFAFLGRPMPMHRHSHPPIVHHPHRHVHHSGPFLTGLGVGVASGIIASALTPKTVVVAPPPAPVVAIKPVWVPPVYENRPVYDIYGNVIRYDQVLIRAGYWQYWH